MNRPLTHVIGLIGRSVLQSRSPAIHEAEAAALGIPLAYRLIDFDALGLADEALPAMARQLASIGFSGCNVTFPFKQAAMPLCDKLSDAARVIGAVNVLRFSDGMVIGDNSDWFGFHRSIESSFGAIAQQRIAQVGAGGAGSATAYALARLGAAEVALFDPSIERAEGLAKRLAPHFPNCSFVVCSSAAAAICGCAGVVNATPVGMASWPGVPFDPALMNAQQWCIDIIYFPLETELLRRARVAGQRTSNGIGMVIGQAAMAFESFTGVAPDIDRMMARLAIDIAAEAHDTALS